MYQKENLNIKQLELANTKLAFKIRIPFDPIIQRLKNDLPLKMDLNFLYFPLKD